MDKEGRNAMQQCSNAMDVDERQNAMNGLNSTTGNAGRKNGDASKTGANNVLAEDDAIPAIVQRSLGMQNLKYNHHEGSASTSTPTPSDNGAIICGLEGVLLPRYLSLRIGLGHDRGGQQQKNTASLPEALMKARDEEIRHRRCRDNRRHKKNASSSSRPGKRKRKADHQQSSSIDRASNNSNAYKAESDAISNVSSRCEDADAVGSKRTPGNEQAMDTNANHKGRRRNKKRRKRSRGSSIGAAEAATCSTHTSSDWVHYQMMARIIIAPYTSSLIAAMKRCKQIISTEEEKQRTKSPGATTMQNAVTKKTAALQVVADALGSAHQSAKKASISAKNIYQKRTKSDPTANGNNNFLTLSPPQESLETIVDGAVCTLVRRTHRFRCQSSSLSSPWFNKSKSGDGRNNDGKKTIYRRRKRRKGNQHKEKTPNQFESSKQQTTTTYPSASRQVKQGVPSVNNYWLLEQNLLSTGYTLGSGDTLTSSSSRTNNNNNNNSHQTTNRSQLLRGCPNMAPGIHCIHPNTLTSYARSSELMRLLHSMVGDDALREILVNSVVLVPAIVTTECSSSSSSSSSGSLFDRGNYFQLCGPPLNVVAKKFDGMSSSLATTKVVHYSRCRKRKIGHVNGENVAVSKTSTSTNSSLDGDDGNNATKKGSGECNDERKPTQKERWDPNKPIARGNLFYCDFYTKHVGLSPRHLLNQCDDDGERSSSSNSDVNIKLLNAMVQLWPRSIRNRSEGKRTMHEKSCSSFNVVHVNKRRGRWRRLRESGIAMCREMRRRHRQCDYSRLLDHHCPLPIKATTTAPSSLAGIETMDAKPALAHHVTLHTSAENVGSFVEAVLRRAFPTSFWGSIHNFHQVVQTVRVFTKLGRTEQIPEKAIVDGIRVLDMAWLLPHSKRHLLARRSESGDDPGSRERRQSPKFSRSDHESTTTLVRNVMRWLYCQFIIPLLRSTFYITETEFTGNRVLYYRRPVWTKIKHFSMKLLLKQQYREINAVKAQKVISSHNVGCPPAPLRLLPKKTGIRAIAMLSKSCPMEGIIGKDSKPKGKDTNEVTTKARLPLLTKHHNNSAPPNKVLQPTFHALKYEHEKKPSLFGAGVMGLTEVFPSFCLFVEALKQKFPNFGSSTTAGAGISSHQSPIYFASADIKHCYDTINQKRLYKLMRSVVEEDVYLTKNNFILHAKENNSSLRCRWKKSTFSPDQFSRFLTSSNTFAENCFHSILVDGIHCSMEKKETISGVLRDHIFGQVVVANGSHGRQRYLLQKDGIPQGSILSSMFCNIYFGNIEGHILGDIFEKESSRIIGRSFSSDCDAFLVQSQADLHLLVRIVDDFLLISTNKETSIRFLKKVNKGIPSLGVKINNDKSRVNYPLTLENADTGEMETVSECQNLFPWCGLLINPKTCEISLDHERFSGPKSIDTVVVHRAGNEGLHLKKKMKDFVRPRCCQKLLFSSCMNGIDRIRLNFYQTFLLCAIKTAHYTRNSDRTSSMRPQFIYNSACDTIQFAFLLISSKIKHGKMMTVPDSRQTGISFQLAWRDAWWLGRHAFFSVFRREGKHYANLCHLFSQSSRAMNPKDLLSVSRRALDMFPLGGK